MKIAMTGVAWLFAIDCALAQTTREVDIELTLTDDTFVNGNAPSTVFGDTVEPLYIHTYGPKYSLFRFDTTPIAGSQVVDARIRMNLQSLAADGLFYFHAILDDWDENTVTYNSMPAFELPETATGETILASARLTSLARRWADGELAGNGVLVRAIDPIRALVQSKENGGGATLTVTVIRENARRPLDLSSVPIVIDEPGYYYLDRDWELDHAVGFSGTAITVEADDVTLDFQQHIVTFRHAGLGIDANGDDFTLRNGTFNGDLDSSVLASEGSRAVVEYMNIYSYEGIQVASGAVRYSEIRGRFGSGFGAGVDVAFNTFNCFAYCVTVAGDYGQLRDNLISTGTETALRVSGSNNRIVGNFISAGTESFELVEVSGNHNNILDNEIASTSYDNVLLYIEGTGNVIDGNNAIPRFVPSEPNDVGILFVQDGNYYGNNRMTGTVPYQLGGTVQTDWGGNVSY